MELKTTPLHSRHVALGARMAAFAGFDMPISYDAKTGGMLKEHLAVRSAVGMFDVCHMGEFWVTGREATKFLSWACTRTLVGVENGRAVYCMLLQKDGGIVDDIIVYKLNDETYWVVVNASNMEKDFAHLSALATSFDVTLKNVSDATGLIAIQGPQAVQIAQQLFPEAVSLKYYRFMKNERGWIIARTGYTGEDGFEIFLPSAETPALWDALAAKGVMPIGLGARDTLRLEVGFSLYGHELSDTLRPSETYSAFAFDAAHTCHGAEAARAPARYLPIALIGATPKPMRAEEKILWNGQIVGSLTSGSVSPARKLGIGLGLIEVEKVPPTLPESAVFMLESGGKSREAVLTKTPFVSTPRVKGATKAAEKKFA